MNINRIDIIVPVYNENEIISFTLDELYAKIKTDFIINIIYDFDEDTTIPVVREYIRRNNLKNIFLIKNNYGKGVVNALRKGFDISKDLATLVVMGDLSDDISIVDRMFKKILDGYDLVCGSRYMKGGKQTGGPVFKKFLTRMAGLSLNFFTKIPTCDISNSFKMYRTSMVKKFNLESTGGFEIGLEILVKAFLNGYKITELPSVWRERTFGKSNFKLIQWLPKYLKWYFMAFTKK